jgi:hypothetical protein
LFNVAASWGATVHASHGAAFDWSGEQTLEVIARSVKTKANVVTADPLEKGRRAILNAGHTVAHALERESGYALLHGEAVAIGLVVEAALGEAAGITAKGTADALRSALGGSGLPTTLPQGSKADQLIDAMRVDKKSRGGNLAFALLASSVLPQATMPGMVGKPRRNAGARRALLASANHLIVSPTGGLAAALIALLLLGALAAWLLNVPVWAIGTFGILAGLLGGLLVRRRVNRRARQDTEA